MTMPYRTLTPPTPPRGIPWWSQPYTIKLRSPSSPEFILGVSDGILGLIAWSMWGFFSFLEMMGHRATFHQETTLVALIAITLLWLLIMFKIVRKNPT